MQGKVLIEAFVKHPLRYLELQEEFRREEEMFQGKTAHDKEELEETENLKNLTEKLKNELNKNQFDIS
jgi:hypothetical protein